jgi:hypothetical protein
MNADLKTVRHFHLCLSALSSGATPASRTEGERSETEVKAAGVVACSELLGGGTARRSDRTHHTHLESKTDA